MAVLRVRRGDSGSKGSLSYGEIYFNTDTPTVEFGDENGDAISILTLNSVWSSSFSIEGVFSATSFSGSFTGSFIGTASYSPTASYIEFLNIANKPSLISGSSQVQLDGISGTTFSDNNYIFPQNLKVSENITAKRIIISSSVIDREIITDSGSTFFGDSLDDTHKFIGKVSFDTALDSPPTSLYGNLFGTSSWAERSVTASFASEVNLTGSNGVSRLEKVFELGGGLYKDTLINGVKDGTLNFSWPTSSINGRTIAFALDETREYIYFGGTSGSIGNGLLKINLATNEIDTSFNFGGSGISGSTPTSTPFISSIVVESNGKIYIAGGFQTYNGNLSPCLARLNSNGSFDTTFNVGAGFSGFSQAGFDSTYPYGIFRDDYGKIFAFGSFASYSGSGAIGLVRINTDGTKDNTFASPISSPGVVVHAIKAPSDKIYIFGTFISPFRSLKRLNYNGTVDGAFNVGSDPLGGVNYLTGVYEGCAALDSQNRVVLVGQFTSYRGSATNRIVRINTDGTFDSTFNVGGSGITAGTAFGVYFGYVYIDEFDRIYITGPFTVYNGVTQNRIFRLLPNGQLDRTFNIGNGFSSAAVADLLVQRPLINKNKLYTSITRVGSSGDTTYRYNNIDGGFNWIINSGLNEFINTDTILDYDTDYRTFYRSGSLIDKAYFDTRRNSFTGSLLGTSSYGIYTPISATASYLNNLQQNVLVTSSIELVGSLERNVLSSSILRIGNKEFSSFNTTTKQLFNFGENTIYTIPFSDINSITFEYVLSSGSNARAGKITGLLSGSNVNYFEVGTTYIGDTSNVKLGVFQNGGNLLLSGSFYSNLWDVRAIVSGI